MARSSPGVTRVRLERLLSDGRVWTRTRLKQRIGGVRYARMVAELEAMVREGSVVRSVCGYRCCALYRLKVAP